MSDQVTRFLALARDGLQVPTSVQQAGAELHKAALRIKVMRPTSANRVMDALEAIAAEWPEVLRPALAEMARIAGFAVQAPDRMPAAEGSAARRKGKRSDGDDGGDQAPPDDLGEDGDASPEAGEYRFVVRRWIRFVRVVEGVRPNATCGWLDERNGDVPCDATTDDMRTRFVHSHQLRHAPLKDNMVKTCVEATVTGWRKERNLEIRSRIIGSPATDAGRAALRAVVKALTGGEDELHEAVLRHWLWQVKRRASGMGVDWDLMPVLVGRQGSGKTTAVDQLSAIMDELSVPVTAQQIVDPRETPLLSLAYIARWDEMSGASRADGDAVKRAISMTQAASRRLYSNDFEVRRRTITFIGTSNFSLAAILGDTSGARRFAEIPVNQVDFDLWNAIDKRQAWESVSEMDPAPILDHLGALREHQAKIIPADLMSLWLEYENARGFRPDPIYRSDSKPLIIPPLDPLMDGAVHPGGWSNHQVQALVGDFSRLLNRPTVPPDRLHQRLVELGWVQRQVSIGAARPRHWFLNPDVRLRLQGVEPTPTVAADPVPATPDQAPQGAF